MLMFCYGWLRVDRCWCFLTLDSNRCKHHSRVISACAEINDTVPLTDSYNCTKYHSDFSPVCFMPVMFCHTWSNNSQPNLIPSPRTVTPTSYQVQQQSPQPNTKSNNSHPNLIPSPTTVTPTSYQVQQQSRQPNTKSNNSHTNLISSPTTVTPTSYQVQQQSPQPNTKSNNSHANLIPSLTTVTPT